MVLALVLLTIIRIKKFKMRTIIITLVFLSASISSVIAQDLIERVKQGIKNKHLNITEESSVLAQKFMNTNVAELPVKELFHYKSIDQDRRQAMNINVSDAVFLDIEKSKLLQFKESKNTDKQIVLRIPVDHTHYYDLLLEKAEALDINFRLLTSEGDRISYQPPGDFYNGIIIGVPESFATVSISDGRIEIIASGPSGNYVITELVGTESEYVMFNDFKLKQKHNFSCGTNDDDFVIPENHNRYVESSKKQVRRNVEVYIEVDYDIYVDHGNSTTQTMNYVLDVFRAAVSLFEKEQISLRLNKVKIWTTNNDPFNGINNFDDFGDDLDDWASDGFTDADIAHYIGTTENIGGLANGIGEFCDQEATGIFPSLDDTSHCASLGMDTPFIEVNSDQSAALGYSVPTWELLVFCHEMGHVFGSPHTHACAWNGNGTQIDDCGNVSGDSNPSCYNSNSPIIPSNGGTIMSYCHKNPVRMNLSFGFGSQPGNLIRSVINNSSCIGTYSLPCPEVQTIEEDVATNGIFDAKKEILIHDATITSGFDPTFTGGNIVDLYGNFECPANAGFRLTNTGCN